MELRQYPSYVGTHTPRTRLRFMTVGAVRLALHHRGGWLEVLRTGPLPRYAPHLGRAKRAGRMGCGCGMTYWPGHTTICELTTLGLVRWQGYTP